MAFISEATIQEVLRRADIVEVIQDYIPLDKKGKNFIGLCPFHEDSKPSMNVNVEKQIFKCFSCNEGGNAISFVQKYNNISFPEAVKIVGSKYGIEIDVQEKVSQIPPETLRSQELLNTVKEYANYELLTQKGSKHYQYIDERLGLKTIEDYGIGYISSSEKLKNFLEAKGYSEIEMRKAGVMNDWGSSFLNERICFPIMDANGTTVGFSGRTLSADKDVAKYMNSVESDLFKKGSLLFNYKEAMRFSRQLGVVHVMEGYMDVLKAESIGIHNCVAVMGTALSNQQLDLLKKLKVPVNLVLDGDKAGVKATLTHYRTLSNAGLEVKATLIPDSLDPDEYMKQNGEYIKELLASSGNILDYRLQMPLDITNFEQNETYAMNFMKDLEHMNNELAEDVYIEALSEKTNFSKESLKRRYLTLKPKTAIAKAKVKSKKVSSSNRAKSTWSQKQVKINFSIKEKMHYKDEMQKNFDRLHTEGKVLAFNDRQIMNRQDILRQYVDQKGKVLETTITLLTSDDMSAHAQAVASVAANQIAKDLDVPRANLEYIAFLHKDTKFPHIHLQCYQKETYLSDYNLQSELVENLQEEITKSLIEQQEQVEITNDVAPSIQM